MERDAFLLRNKKENFEMLVTLERSDHLLRAKDGKCSEQQHEFVYVNKQL